jgi:site-specific DNA-methyltransferase (adenine-specific)
MDMSRFVSALTSSLNTVSSWKDCLVAASTDASTSTTGTASSTTIDLKIWKSCLSKITPESIILAHGQGEWSSVSAGTAERYLNACVLKWKGTQELSALASVFALDAANSQHEGAISPLMELVCVARKPLSERTVAANVLRHGTGGINIDATRIPLGATDPLQAGITGRDGHGMDTAGTEGAWGFKAVDRAAGLGRWPSNVMHDGSPEVLEAFAAYGERATSKPGAVTRNNSRSGGDVMRSGFASTGAAEVAYGDSGTASRFFYSAKATSADRADSRHPTVKPLALIEYLVKLITPPGGRVLDCFAGSGITGEACMKLGFDCTLIEKDEGYARDIRHRIKRWSGLDCPLFADHDLAAGA